jgi:hypothetical protein
MTDVTYVDSVGEKLLLWLRDLQATFVPETCYVRRVCPPVRAVSPESAGHDPSKPALEKS